MKWTRNEGLNFKILATSALTAAATIGGAVGYVVASKIHEKRLAETLDRELAKAKELYQQMYSEPVFVKVSDEEVEPEPSDESLEARIRVASVEIDGMPVDVVGRALGAVRDYSGDEDVEEVKSGTDERPQFVNLFEHHEAPGEEVLAALMMDRDPSAPYIITKEEFLAAETDYDQKRFTFYSGDSILVDDQDEYNPITKTDLVAGDDNLRHFGYGSGDEWVLYVRNETLDPPLDLHITKSTGKYAVEVMAFDDDSEPHVQHSQPRKFRLRDE